MLLNFAPRSLNERSKEGSPRGCVFPASTPFAQPLLLPTALNLRVVQRLTLLPPSFLLLPPQGVEKDGEGNLLLSTLVPARPNVVWKSIIMYHFKRGRKIFPSLLVFFVPCFHESYGYMLVKLTSF